MVRNAAFPLMLLACTSLACSTQRWPLLTSLRGAGYEQKAADWGRNVSSVEFASVAGLLPMPAAGQALFYPKDGMPVGAIFGVTTIRPTYIIEEVYDAPDKTKFLEFTSKVEAFGIALRDAQKTSSLLLATEQRLAATVDAHIAFNDRWITKQQAMAVGTAHLEEETRRLNESRKTLEAELRCFETKAAELANEIAKTQLANTLITQFSTSAQASVESASTLSVGDKYEKVQNRGRLLGTANAGEQREGVIILGGIKQQQLIAGPDIIDTALASTDGIESSLSQFAFVISVVKAKHVMHINTLTQSFISELEMTAKASTQGPLNISTPSAAASVRASTYLSMISRIANRGTLSDPIWNDLKFEGFSAYNHTSAAPADRRDWSTVVSTALQGRDIQRVLSVANKLRPVISFTPRYNTSVARQFPVPYTILAATLEKLNSNLQVDATYRGNAQLSNALTSLLQEYKTLNTRHFNSPDNTAVSDSLLAAAREIEIAQSHKSRPSWTEHRGDPQLLQPLYNAVTLLKRANAINQLSPKDQKVIAAAFATQAPWIATPEKSHTNNVAAQTPRGRRIPK